MRGGKSVPAAARSGRSVDVLQFKHDDRPRLDGNAVRLHNTPNPRVRAGGAAQGSTAMPPGTKAALAATVSLLLSACGAGSSSPDLPGASGPGGGTVGYPKFGQPLPGSTLSPVEGAADGFGADVAPALFRAARSVPSGTTQSSSAAGGLTADEVTARIVRDDDGNVVYEVTDGARTVLHVPGMRGDGFELALFTDLIPGIEPDLTSYPHEVLGLWAWEGEAGAFWDRSPSLEPAAFDSRLTGTAAYDGEAVGLRAAGGTVDRFLADVALVADFSTDRIGGTVDGFRSFNGTSLGGLSVTLGAASLSRNGDAFSGDTSSGAPGGGKWGARWSDGRGWTVGGTFGFAADDESVALLGAFTACACASTAGGRPGDPVASGN